MHSHWRPPALIEALRDRETMPRIETNDDGIEVLNSNRGSQPVSEAFDNLDERLVEMDRQGVSTAVLSLFGMFQWIERLPVAESQPLVQIHNDALSDICRDHAGRFAAYASLPLSDLDAAIAELERTMALPGIIGAQIPGNAFLTYETAQAFRPLMAAADKHGAVMFIHWGPLPGDDWPRVNMSGDNASRRLGTLDMQASLSANMVTLSLTDYLADYPNARVHLHNLGGNLPYEVERMDHRCLLDTPDEQLPSTRFDRPNLFVDCNSFGPQAIEAGVKLYGADKILYGTDGTEFGAEWTNKALADANIGDDARQAIHYGNAAALLGKLTDIAPQRQAAE